MAGRGMTGGRWRRQQPWNRSSLVFLQGDLVEVPNGPEHARITERVGSSAVDCGGSRYDSGGFVDAPSLLSLPDPPAESRTVERITGATNVPDGTWMLTSAGPCVQRIVSHDLGWPI